MNPDTFFDNFELLADVPDGVKKLRELILQLAVQGKLVAQDENDEPAAVLLEKIRAERLVKKPKELPPIKKNNASNLLPKEWKWAMLGEIAEIVMGNSPSGDTYNEIGEGVPLINGPVEFSNGPFGFTIKSKFTTKPTKFCEKGDLLVCVRGSTTGRTNIAAFEACIGRGVAAIRSKVHQPYINYFILSMRQQIYDLGTGSTFPSISQHHLVTFLVPLPPLTEQHRIVSKVDQLMALCDELEAHQKKKHEARMRLNSAALDKFTSAPEDITKHWQRISDNFDLLYDAPETVVELRKAILQLAVMGKLVAQDENDKPASVLLDRIKEEKKRLLKAGKIKKSKPLSLNDVEKPYELPANWKWTRLFDIGIINPRNEAEDDMDTSFIPMRLISETYTTPISSEKRKWGKIKSGFTHFAEEDVVLAKITPCFQNGKSAIMRNLSNGIGAGTTELHVYRPLLEESVNPDYVLLYLRTPKFLTEGIEKMTGTAGQKRVPRDYFAGNPFPLPPLEEQHRIVARVDQLMNLCDELEAKLAQSQTDGTGLMEAVVGEMVTV